MSDDSLELREQTLEEDEMYGVVPLFSGPAVLATSIPCVCCQYGRNTRHRQPWHSNKWYLGPVF
jgi:hypothetical protein